MDVREREVVVARIRRPWGRVGEVLVDLHTDWPEERFAAGASLACAWEDGRRRDVRAAGLTRRGASVMLAVEGVTTIDEAENLAGAWLVAERGDVAASEPGEVHQADLIGLEVVPRDAPDAPFGRVVEVVEGVGQELLAVQPGGGGAPILVPFVSGICVEVDLAAGRLVVDPPRGLLDPDEAVVAGGDDA